MNTTFLLKLRRRAAAVAGLVIAGMLLCLVARADETDAASLVRTNAAVTLKPAGPVETGFTKRDIKDFVGLSIPILAIVFGIGLGGFATVLEFKKRRELLNLCHLERMAALEKGLELPPYPTDSRMDGNRTTRASLTPTDCLVPGLALVSGGLGIGTIVGLVALWRIGLGVGALLVFSGLGFLAYYRFGPKSGGGPGTQA